MPEIKLKLSDSENETALDKAINNEREECVVPRSLDYGRCSLRDRKTGIVYANMDGWNSSIRDVIWANRQIKIPCV